MLLNNILENKRAIISSAALILVPYYAWRSLYHSYKTLRSEYSEALLFHKRHNCVVMYSERKGMSGWPPNTGRVKVDINKKNSLNVVHEPILYFIETAKKSIDVAFMILGVSSVHTALINAHRRGIKIRILLNFDHSDGKLEEIRVLMREGIEVLTYVSQRQGLGSIMHYKYMVKDYTECTGYVFTGSLNLSGTGFLNNYEDIVFTSNQYVSKAYHEDFEECWSFVKSDNENLFNKSVLLDANLA